MLKKFQTKRGDSFNVEETSSNRGSLFFSGNFLSHFLLKRGVLARQRNIAIETRMGQMETILVRAKRGLNDGVREKRSRKGKGGVCKVLCL